MAKEGYGALASICFELRWRLFKLRPKGHLYLHTSTLNLTNKRLIFP